MFLVNFVTIFDNFHVFTLLLILFQNLDTHNTEIDVLEVLEINFFFHQHGGWWFLGNSLILRSPPKKYHSLTGLSLMENFIFCVMYISSLYCHGVDFNVRITQTCETNYNACKCSSSLKQKPRNKAIKYLDVSTCSKSSDNPLPTTRT